MFTKYFLRICLFVTKWTFNPLQNGKINPVNRIKVGEDRQVEDHVVHVIPVTSVLYKQPFFHPPNEQKFLLISINNLISELTESLAK